MRRLLPIAAVLVLALTFALPGATSARPGPPDDVPCGEPFPHTGIQRLVQECDLWRGKVPVYESTGPGIFSGDNEIVGYLESATGNWFVCQDLGEEYTVPGTSFSNDFWANTVADNGEWGWVPEAYFKGGGNFQPDAGLERC